jgi:hypothetical protein
VSEPRLIIAITFHEATHGVVASLLCSLGTVEERAEIAGTSG